MISLTKVKIHMKKILLGACLLTSTFAFAMQKPSSDYPENRYKRADH